MECADAANGVDGHIMADGGCVHQVILLKHLEVEPMVMIGGMLTTQRRWWQHYY